MQEYKKYILLAGVFLIVMIFIYYGYQILQIKRKETINKSHTINQKGKNKLYFFYRLFRDTPGIKKIFQRILLNTESIYPADPMSVNREATKIMLKGLGFSTIIILITMLIAWYCGGSLLLYLGGILTSVVFFFYNISNTFREMEYKLLEQFKIFLEAVRHHYMNSGIVEDAVEATLDEIPYEIGLHISRIHEILISPIMEEKVEEYTASAPNRFFLLLLSICSSIKEYGGDSFTESLSHLKEEINVEILKMDAIKDAFSGIQLVSLCVVMFLKPIQMWAEYCMPELSEFYNGTYGTSIMIIAFVSSFAAYYLVDILRDSRRGELVKENIFSKIAQIPRLSKLLNRIINKNYTKYRCLNEQMKEVGDQTGPKAFLVKQVIFAMIAFVVITSTTITSTIKEKLTMLENYVAEFDTDVVPNERYMEIMKQASYDYVNALKGANMDNLTEEDISKNIIANGTMRNEEYAQIVAQEVMRELNAYKNTYYKWYMLIAAMIIAIIAFHVPKWFLDFKCRVSSMNKEDEIAQFQTLVLILMNVDGIRLDDILEWMDRFAYCFKETIDECIVTLESGEQQALEKMKMSEDNESFKRFVDCLLCIDESDVPTAFGEIRIDRDYSLRKREQDNNIAIRKKSSIASMIGMAPAMVVLIGYLLIPMGIMSIKMYASMDFDI